MVETVKTILAMSLIGMLSACAAMNRGADDIRTIDHAVAHVSTVPAIKGEAVQLFVREKVLASESATPRPVVLMVHGGVSPATLAFDVEHESYSWMNYLARAGFDVFAMDMTGYGKSARAEDGRSVQCRGELAENPDSEHFERSLQAFLPVSVG